MTNYKLKPEAKRRLATMNTHRDSKVTEVSIVRTLQTQDCVSYSCPLGTTLFDIYDLSEDT